MSFDISKMLADWDFNPNQVSARVITGDDGREKLQLRLDLGLMQMEMDGRPDGKRIRDCESWLDYYDRIRRSREADDPDKRALVLEANDCVKLLREGVQYYHRYLCFWHLKLYERCARDTARNLRLFDFVRAHARHKRDWMQFEQWRPYVVMMHTRAVATPLEELGDTTAALKVIIAGIDRINSFLEHHGQTSRAGDLGELVFLKKWRDRMNNKSDSPPLLTESAPPPEPVPQDPLSRLQDQLSQAVADERYEEAAEIRDQIVQLSGGQESADETDLA